MNWLSFGKNGTSFDLTRLASSPIFLLCAYVRDLCGVGSGGRGDASAISRLLKNAHLLRYPHSSSLRRTSMYASLFGISGALHLAVFEQPE
jgi:hypothetical protein